MNINLLLILAGWMSLSSVVQTDQLTADSINELKDQRLMEEGMDRLDNETVQLSHHARRAGKRSKPRTFAYATLPTTGTTGFPACAKVFFTQLTITSKNVFLKNGELELPRGTYRLAYGCNLQNNGGADLIQMWLTINSWFTQTIPNSQVQANIGSSSQFGPIAFISDGEVLVRINRTSRVSLNYATRGTSILTGVTPAPVIIPGEPPNQSPFPFYLFAIKVGDINT